MGAQGMDSERFETVVVGGGQAGLAAGYHLARRGRSFVILDAGQRIGDPWRGRWDSLRLFTPAPLLTACPAWAFPPPRWSLSHQGRGGRLPRGLRGPVRSCRSAPGSGSTG